MLEHSDQEELLEYINSLEEDIEEETEAEKTLDIVIKNVLEKYDYFKDPRHLKAGNIMAVNGLLKTKKDIKDTKVSHKKDLLSTVIRKRESDARNKTMLEINDKETDTPIDFRTLLLKLDTLNIHPIVTEEQIKQAKTLVEKHEKTEENETDSLE